MSDFTPITTQEEFDSAIKDRLNREREKFSDYETIKTQNTEYAEALATYKSQVEDLTSKNTEFKKSVATLQQKVTGYEKANLKIKVAQEAGIPYELANKLSGDDEKALKKDAETLKKFITKKTPPLHDDEGRLEDKKTTALRKMLGDLKKE